MTPDMVRHSYRGSAATRASSACRTVMPRRSTGARFAFLLRFDSLLEPRWESSDPGHNQEPRFDDVPSTSVVSRDFDRDWSVDDPVQHRLLGEYSCRCPRKEYTHSHSAHGRPVPAVRCKGSDPLPPQPAVPVVINGVEPQPVRPATAASSRLITRQNPSLDCRRAARVHLHIENDEPHSHHRRRRT